MSPVTRFLIEDGGMSKEMLIILIALPFISSIVGIARYYIGIKTFSLYSPIILTVSYFLLQVGYEGSTNQKIITGGLFGVIFTVIVITTSIITHRIIKRVRLHFFPKISLGLSTVTIVLFLSLISFHYFDIVKPKDINLISLVLIAVVSEQFLNTYVKKSFDVSVRLSIETILLSLVCYLILIIRPVQDLLLSHPEIIILTIPLNYIIGKFQGLRLVELFRFQDILDKDKVPNEPN